MTSETDTTPWIFFRDTTNQVNNVGDPATCLLVNVNHRKYVLQDEQMSIVGLTDKDGGLIEGIEYDPYGAATVYQPSGLLGLSHVTWTTSDSIHDARWANIAYTYTGRRYDPEESHLLYYRSRYLDTELGRFVSRDTIGVWGDPKSLGNGYAYVANQVEWKLDPSGRWSLRSIWTSIDEKIHSVLGCYLNLYLDAGVNAPGFNAGIYVSSDGLQTYDGVSVGSPGAHLNVGICGSPGGCSVSGYVPAEVPVGGAIGKSVDGSGDTFIEVGVGVPGVSVGCSQVRDEL